MCGNKFENIVHQKVFFLSVLRVGVLMIRMRHCDFFFPLVAFSLLHARFSLLYLSRLFDVIAAFIVSISKKGSSL